MREYHYPDFMPEEGELIFVRDFKTQEWRSRAFHKYMKGIVHPWCIYDVNGSITAWRYAAPYSAMPEPVLYTEEDLPMLGQPILVRDYADEGWTVRIFLRFSAGDGAPWKVVSPVHVNVGYRYAAHYDEQFWLAQQKKKEPVDASKQAEKLAAQLAAACVKSNGCPYTGKGVYPCLGRKCGAITKEDWLAWAAKQED